MRLNLNMNYLQMRRVFVAKDKTPSYDKEEIKNRREQRNQKKRDKRNQPKDYESKQKKDYRRRKQHDSEESRWNY